MICGSSLRIRRVQIRQAGQEDTAELAALLGQLGYPATAAAVEARLARLREDESTSVLVALEDERIVGVASSYTRLHLVRDGSTCRLTALVVDEGARRGGIGRALLSRVAEDAERRGCDRVEVTLQPEREAAKALYLSAGFEERPLRLIRQLRPG
jgi:ribosomal protein S18 acetylase RimI-like enzyme